MLVVSVIGNFCYDFTLCYSKLGGASPVLVVTGLFFL